jgi:hypothetical protein
MPLIQCHECSGQVSDHTQRSHTVIVALTVTEILDEQITKKLA